MDFDIYLDSDYKNYFFDAENSIVLIDGFESGCMSAFSSKEMKPLLRVVEDGADLGLFTWELVEGDMIRLVKSAS